MQRGHGKDHINHIKESIPDSIEVHIGGDEKEEAGHKHVGWLLELICDLPDNADSIHYGGSDLISTVVLGFFTLATIGILFYKLLKKWQRKKRFRFGKGGLFHSSHHSSVKPVITNVISFDPKQNNMGWSSAGSGSSSKAHAKGGHRWKNRKLTGQEIHQLVRYLKDYRNGDDENDDDYDSDYY